MQPVGNEPMLLGRRAAGIGTAEAIRLVWSCHREVITDYGPAPADVSALKTT